MPKFGLNLTSAGQGGDLAGKTIEVEAESLSEAIAEAEATHRGLRVIRGTRTDVAPSLSDAAIEAWMEAHRAATPRRK